MDKEMLESDIYALYEQEKKVGEYYAAIGSIMRSTWKVEELDTFLNMSVAQISRYFDWQITAILLTHDDDLVLHSCNDGGKVCETAATIRLREHNARSDILLDVLKSLNERRSSKPLTTFPQLNPSADAFQFLAYPLMNRRVPTGILLLGRTHGEFDDCETEILKDLASYIALAMDNIAMYEERQRNIIAAERNRLANNLYQLANTIHAGIEDNRNDFSQAMNPSVSPAQPSNATTLTADILTPKEQEVLHHITLGKSNKEIAADLRITEKTVKTHVTSILSKMDVQDRTQAAIYAIRNNWFEYGQ